MNTNGSLLTALRDVYVLARRRFRDEMASLELTPRQATLLLAIARQPGIGLTEAAEAIGGDVATCSQLVWRMSERGLLDRRDDRADRRRLQLFLTPQGEALCVLVSRAERTAEQRIANAAGPDGADLRRLLKDLKQRLTEQQVEAGGK